MAGGVAGLLLDVDISDFILIGEAVSSGPSFDSGLNDFPTELDHIFDAINFLLRCN